MLGAPRIAIPAPEPVQMQRASLTRLALPLACCALLVATAVLAPRRDVRAPASPPTATVPATERPVPYGLPGVARTAANLERLPLDSSVDTRAAYRRAERHVATMPRYSSALGRRLDGGTRRAGELEGAWEPLGPINDVGGRTRTLVVAPDDGTLYAGGVSGGVWKRRRRANRWTAVGDELQNLAVNSMAMDPRDSRTIVVGTGEGYFREDVRGTGLPLRGGGIFRTTDGARNWAMLEATDGEDFWFVNDLLYSPDGARLYAATRTGVFRTFDDGASWEQVLEPEVTGGCLDLALRERRGRDVLFAACGTFERASVWRSEDAGGGADGWEVVLSEPGMGRTSLAIAPSDPDVVYALAASVQPGRFEGGLHGVFRSTRRGDAGTWSARVRNSDRAPNNYLLLENAVTELDAICAGGALRGPVPMGWYVNTIAVDPTNPDVVWAAGVDWFRSDDGGASWGPASFWWADSRAPSKVHADQHGLVFDPGYDGVRNRTAYALTDGGIYRTDDALAPVTPSALALCDPASSQVAFERINNGLAITQFYHGAVSPDGSLVVAGAQDNGTRAKRLPQRRDSWPALFGGDGSYSAIDPEDPSLNYVQSQFANVVKIDGVSPPRSARNGLPQPIVNLLSPGENFLFITPLAIFPRTPERGPESLLLGGHRLYLTEDRAESWTSLGRRMPKKGLISALATSSMSGDRVLLGTHVGHLLYTDRLSAMNSRTRWKPRRRPRKAWVTSVAFGPDRDGDAALYATYGGFGGSHLYRSIDGAGRRWRSIDGDLPDIPVHSVVVDPDNDQRIFIGTDLGVFVTTDGGVTWAQEIAGFGNIVTEWLLLQEEGAKLMLYAFTHGRGAWRVQVAR